MIGPVGMGGKKGSSGGNGIGESENEHTDGNVGMVFFCRVLVSETPMLGESKIECNILEIFVVDWSRCG